MTKKSLKELIKMLDASESEVRLFAIEALGKKGAKAAQAIPKLLKMLENPIRDEHDREEAISDPNYTVQDYVNSQIYFRDRNDRLRELRKKIIENEAKNRSKFFQRLLNIESEAHNYCFHFCDEELRELHKKIIENEMAAIALAQIGKKALPELVKTFLASKKKEDADSCLAENCLKALIQFKQDAEPVQYELICLLYDATADQLHNKRLLPLISECLIGMGSLTVEELRKDLGCADAMDFQREAVWILGEIGEQSACAVPQLIETLRIATSEEDEDDYVPKFTIEALGKIGEKASMALPILSDLLKSESLYCSELSLYDEIAMAISKINPELQKALFKIKR